MTAEYTCSKTGGKCYLSGIAEQRDRYLSNASIIRGRIAEAREGGDVRDYSELEKNASNFENFASNLQ